MKHLNLLLVAALIAGCANTTREQPQGPSSPGINPITAPAESTDPKQTPPVASDPQDTLLPSNMGYADEHFGSAMGAVSADVQKLVAQYIARVMSEQQQGVGPGVPPGTTIKQAAQSQREWNAKYPGCPGLYALKGGYCK